MSTCAKCSAAGVIVSPNGLCHAVDAKGERVIGSGCYGLAETADAARLDALATAIGTTRDKVTPARLEVAAAAVKRQWHEVTAADIAGLAASARTAMVKAVAKVTR